MSIDPTDPFGMDIQKPISGHVNGTGGGPTPERLAQLSKTAQRDTELAEQVKVKLRQEAKRVAEEQILALIDDELVKPPCSQSQANLHFEMMFPNASDRKNDPNRTGRPRE